MNGSLSYSNIRSTTVPSALTKYGTVSGLARPPSSRPILDSALFGPPDGPGESALAALAHNAVDSWEISVGERKVVGADRSRKRQKSAKEALELTIYVTTNTTSLTLSRSLKQIADFDAKVRFSSRFFSRVPCLI
jgi:hypothetical protein